MHRSPIQLAAALTLALTCTGCRERPAPPPPPVPPPTAPTAPARSPTPASAPPTPDPAPSPTTTQPDANATESYTLRGKFIRRGQTKSFEAWNAACDFVHLLELDEHTKLELPLQRTIQLRPSTLVSCQDLDTFADAQVEIECTYTPGKRYAPPQPGDPDFNLQRPIGPVIDGKEQPQSRGFGFIVEKIRRLYPAPPAQQSAR